MHFSPCQSGEQERQPISTVRSGTDEEPHPGHIRTLPGSIEASIHAGAETLEANNTHSCRQLGQCVTSLRAYAHASD